MTGLLDCRWADRAAAASVGDDVRLDRKYDLAAGLVELTYNAGVRIILQGPVRFEVTSPNGELSAGTLTATSLQAKDGNIRTMVSIRTPTVSVAAWSTQFGVAVERWGPRCSPKSCAAISVSWFPSRERYAAPAVGDFGRTAFYTPGPATDAEMYTFVLRAGDRAVSEVSGDLGPVRSAASGPLAAAARLRCAAVEDAAGRLPQSRIYL